MIKKYIDKMARSAINAVAGRRVLQPLSNRLHREICTMMNFGGCSVGSSGEIKVLKDLKGRLGEDATPVIFDVGANIGNYSLAVVSIFGDKVKLYSFEPTKQEIFSSLVSNLRGHKNVMPYNLGFGEKNETAILYSCPPGSLSGP